MSPIPVHNAGWALCLHNSYHECDGTDEIQAFWNAGALSCACCLPAFQGVTPVSAAQGSQQCRMPPSLPDTDSCVHLTACQALTPVCQGLQAYRAMTPVPTRPMQGTGSSAKASESSWQRLLCQCLPAGKAPSPVPVHLCRPRTDSSGKALTSLCASKRNTGPGATLMRLQHWATAGDEGEVRRAGDRTCTRRPPSLRRRATASTREPLSHRLKVSGARRVTPMVYFTPAVKQGLFMYLSRLIANSCRGTCVTGGAGATPPPDAS